MSVNCINSDCLYQVFSAPYRALNYVGMYFGRSIDIYLDRTPRDKKISDLAVSIFIALFTFSLIHFSILHLRIGTPVVVSAVTGILYLLALCTKKGHMIDNLERESGVRLPSVG